MHRHARGWLLAALLLGSSCFAQEVVMPSRVPGLLNLLERPPADQPLKCQMKPLPPALDFSFRFRVRLKIQSPLEQFTGPGHRWDVLLRVTPEQQGSQPVYLASTYALPDVPTKPNQDGEV